MRSIGSQIWNPLGDHQFRCAVHCTVLITTGSPLIRIMVKSIPGTARGSVHASMYKSEANSHVLLQSRQNIETGCSREDCGDQMEEPDRNEGGKADEGGDGEEQNLFFPHLFCVNLWSLQDVTKAGPDADLLNLIQVWAGLWIAPHLSHLRSASPPLNSLSGVS